MDSTIPTPDANESLAAPRKKRGIFGFLFKTALGCTAFAIGSLIVLVMLLPTMLSGVAARTVQSKFAETYKGSVEIGSLDLAWFGEQHVTNVVVRDPDKKEVARASVVMPSLWSLIRSGGERIGHVTIAVDADFVQDDAGVTNLERALEPRHPKPPEAEPKSTDRADHADMFDKLAHLELDLAITSTHLTWSDAETRRLGMPFEVRDLKASVTAKGGAPIDAHADGRIVAEQPGKITLDAHVAGPIAPQKAWPLGKVEAHARIEGFSTAMIDGIARMHGDLKEVLGNHFTLKVDATGASADEGDVDLVLDGEKGSVALHGRLEGGAFRSRAQAAAGPALLVTIPPPRGFLKTYVTPSLPPGTQMVLDASNDPWTVRAQTFAVPLVTAGAIDVRAITTALSKSQLELSVSVPGRIAIENEATRKANVAASVSATRVDVHLVPGTPATVHMESALDSGSPGTLSVDVSAADPWSKLAAGAIPPIDAHVIAKNVSTVAIGALAGEPERIPGAIGHALDVQIDATKANLEAGALRVNVTGRDQDPRFVLQAGARIEGGLVHVDGDDAVRVRWNPDAEWMQHELATLLGPDAKVALETGSDLVSIEAKNVVVPLPAAGTDLMSGLRAKTAADVVMRVSGATWSDATLRAAHTDAAVKGLEATVKLSAGGAISINVHGELHQGTSKGRLTADVSTANAWAYAGGPGTVLPPIDARVMADGIPTALVDAFAQQDGLVAKVLGDKLAVSLDAKDASPTSGTLRVEFTSPRMTATLDGHLENGTFRGSATEGLHVVVKVPEAVVRAQLADKMPEGTTLSWPNGSAEVTFDASDLAVPVPMGGAQPFDLATLLESSNAHLHARLAAVGFANALTRDAKLDAGARDLTFDAVLAPHSHADVKVTALLQPGKDAKLDLAAHVVEPFAVLKGAPMKPIDATLNVTGLDTATLDALAGKQGLLAGLLGPTLDVSLGAKGASMAGGSVTASAKSASLTLSGSAQIDKGTLRCTGQEGFDVALAPRPGAFDAYAKAVLPPGARLQFATDAGPLTLKLHDVSIPLPSGTASGSPAPAAKSPPAGPKAPASGSPAPAVAAEPGMLERVSKMSLTCEATMPAIVYSDAAQQPVTVRNVRIETHLSPTELPYLRVNGAVEATPPGEIAVDVHALDPLAKLAEASALDTWRAKIDVRATQVPTAIIDLLAGQNGLLVEALGAHVDATVQAPEISLSKGAFVADLKSEQDNIHAEGHLADRAVIIDKQDGVLAHVGLGPLMSQRIVGKLLPTLVDVQKPADAAPALIAVDALHFPLDGDLRKLDGNVRLDLGEITYGFGDLKSGLVGKLASALGSSAPTGKWKVPAITVPIKKGVAGYDKLPIQIGGHEYNFSGTYDMVTDVALLSAQVPVKFLGKKVSAELEAVSDYIDPDTTIPITIKGSIRNPSIGLDEGALATVLKKAAEKAAGKGLGGLLDGLKKKKQKD